MTWSTEDAKRLYGIPHWGQDFFSINDLGNITVAPKKDGVSIDLKHLVDDAKKRGLSLPLLVRFSDILQARLETIVQSFKNAMDSFDYQGRYQGVFPVKVNPQRQVIEEILRFGEAHSFGLEAGSKPELHAILAMLQKPSLIICNGNKDESMIRLALMSQRLGHTPFLVIEKLDELQRVLRVSKELSTEPLLGFRVKLLTPGAGMWSSSGGELSKFGMTSSEVLEAIEILIAAGLQHRLQLLHCHLGSQISEIRSIKEGLREMGQYYVALRRAGCPINYIDVGGGLGVDYDGSRSSSGSSINYSIQEYANDVVSHLAETCDKEQLPHPNIISESGRALTAHHSVMIFDTFTTATHPTWKIKDTVPHEAPDCLHDLLHVYQALQGKNTPQMECWHDAVEIKEVALKQFSLGVIGLADRAKAERLFWSIATLLQQQLTETEHIPDELKHLNEVLATQYFGNFSVFQSTPDTWAMNQVFPVMPIHRLNEKPHCDATLHDMTCDSDGKIHQFIQGRQLKTTLPVHHTNQQPYFLGIFLVGAYQEILGDLHNLFGDTNTVHVALNDDKTWRYEQIIHGDRVRDVLGYVQFCDEDLLHRFSNVVNRCLSVGEISEEEAQTLTTCYRHGLQQYTYPDS